MAGELRRDGDGINQRFRLIREGLGLTQLQFLPRLNAAAERIGVRPYSQSTLSKLESGSQSASFDDVAVFAAVDPEGRGKLWLAWNEEEDTTILASHLPLRVASPVRPPYPLADEADIVARGGGGSFTPRKSLEELQRTKKPAAKKASRRRAGGEGKAG